MSFSNNQGLPGTFWHSQPYSASFCILQLPPGPTRVYQQLYGTLNHIKHSSASLCILQLPPGSSGHFRHSAIESKDDNYFNCLIKKSIIKTIRVDLKNIIVLCLVNIWSFKDGVHYTDVFYLVTIQDLYNINIIVLCHVNIC